MSQVGALEYVAGLLTQAGLRNVDAIGANPRGHIVVSPGVYRVESTTGGIDQHNVRVLLTLEGQNKTNFNALVEEADRVLDVLRDQYEGDYWTARPYEVIYPPVEEGKQLALIYVHVHWERARGAS